MPENRNEKGQFKVTTGSTRYKKVQYNGTSMHEHNRYFCVLLGINKIPKGLVVHHIDGNKKNNSLSNLSLMTHGAHNTIHAKDRKNWTQGLTRQSSEKLQRMLDKALASRKGSFIKDACEPVWKLRLKGMTFNEIAKELGVNKKTVSHRMKSYLKYYKAVNEGAAEKIEKYEKIHGWIISNKKSWEEVADYFSEQLVNIQNFYNNFDYGKSTK